MARGRIGLGYSQGAQLMSGTSPDEMTYKRKVTYHGGEHGSKCILLGQEFWPPHVL